MDGTCVCKVFIRWFIFFCSFVINLTNNCALSLAFWCLCLTINSCRLCRIWIWCLLVTMFFLKPYFGKDNEETVEVFMLWFWFVHIYFIIWKCLHVIVKAKAILYSVGIHRIYKVFAIELLMKLKLRLMLVFIFFFLKSEHKLYFDHWSFVWMSVNVSDLKLNSITQCNQRRK